MHKIDSSNQAANTLSTLETGRAQCTEPSEHSPAVMDDIFDESNWKHGMGGSQQNSSKHYFWQNCNATNKTVTLNRALSNCIFITYWCSRWLKKNGFWKLFFRNALQSENWTPLYMLDLPGLLLMYNCGCFVMEQMWMAYWKNTSHLRQSS